MGRAYEVRKSSILKTGAEKAKLYSGFGKEIYMAAKGNPDPESNQTLARLIEKAKGKQVPTDVIKRAIEKAKGGKGEDYHAMRYEGFGPNGANLLIDCLSDNANRTISDVKNCFTKSKNRIGVKGSVSHLYTNTAVVIFDKQDEETVLDVLLEAGCDIIDISNENSETVVYGAGNDLYKIKDAVASMSGDIKFSTTEQEQIPNDYVTLTKQDDLDSFNKLIDMLKDLDDVQTVYHNVEL